MNRDERQLGRLLKNGGASENHPTRRADQRGRRCIESLHAAIAALAFALLFTPLTRADDAQASEQFQVGKRAFETGDYLTALESFEAAVAAGMSGPAVHFNIGVSAYRVGRFLRAETAFFEAARTQEMSALAHYNLGLVALGRSMPEAAIRWFSLVDKESDDERLRALARAQLFDIQRPWTRDWVGYAAVNVGYDDNVALLSGADVLDVSDTGDPFAEVELSASASVAEPWRFDGSLLLIDYENLDTFDQLSANGGVRYRRRVGSWNGEAILQLTYATLDAESFQAKRIFALQASKVLPRNWRLRTRYRFSDINGLGRFDGPDGHRHELDARAAWHGRGWDVAIEYQFDASDYNNEDSSLSRHGFAFTLQRAFSDAWTLGTRLVHEYSNYEIGRDDAEDRYEWEFVMTRALGKRWRLVVRYAHADNDSERPAFDYRRNRVSAGIEAAL